MTQEQPFIFLRCSWNNSTSVYVVVGVVMSYELLWSWSATTTSELTAFLLYLALKHFTRRMHWINFFLPFNQHPETATYLTYSLYSYRRRLSSGRLQLHGWIAAEAAHELGRPRCRPGAATLHGAAHKQPSEYFSRPCSCSFSRVPSMSTQLSTSDMARHSFDGM